MQTYFSAIQPHLQGHVDIAITQAKYLFEQIQSQSTSSRSILSLGIDSLIYVKDLSSEQQNRIYLSQSSNYHSIADSPNPNHCILGGESGAVEQFSLQTQQTKPIYKSQFKINSLCTSPSKRLLAVASDESKSILIDLHTLRSSKCRPGHESGVANVCFNENEKYLASIGIDKTLFIYCIENFQQPLQKFHIKICKTQTQSAESLIGSFHKTLDNFYAPGMKELQVVELLNNKWEYRLSKFVKHTSEVIQLVKMIKVNLMITSSASEFFIWNNRTEQKLVVIGDFSLSKIIEVGETFWGCRDDGRIFRYKKVLQQSIHTQHQPQLMEIQNRGQVHNNNQSLYFDDEAIQDQSEQKEEKEQQQQEIIYEQQKKKKSKADRIITAYPQSSVTTATTVYDSARYLATSHNGYLIERTQNQYQVRVQFEREDKPITELLFVNKKINSLDFNQLFVAWVNDTEYGVKFLKNTDYPYFDQSESWEKNWEDILAVACTNNWIAVANDQEIKIIDVTGNQLKTIAFDRLIVAMAAYENLLAVVYHDSIPIDGCQSLSMQLYIVNNEKLQALKCSTCHVPLKPRTNLKYFRFTNQGMLLSHDDGGYIRVYNLEYNTWSSVILQNVEDTRRIWLLGMKNYQLIYWNTSQLDPNPRVFPRLPVKSSRLGTNVIADDSEKMMEYPFLMFQRFCLDHEKCRFRLWSHLKQTRTQKYPGYQENIQSILTLKQINQRHNQLDYNFFSIIKFYLENPKSHQKALMASKTLIRTIQAGKRFIDIFDDLNLRSLAVELEIYFDEKEKQIEYQLMQNLQLQRLKQEAEKNIKPKGQNNPFNKKKNNDFSSIPSLNNSQMSQASNFDNLSERSTYKPVKENGMKMGNIAAMLETPQKQEISNPFLKKKSAQEDLNYKTRQIEEQIQKYGIKKKAEINKRPSKL